MALDSARIVVYLETSIVSVVNLTRRLSSPVLGGKKSPATAALMGYGRSSVHCGLSSFEQDERRRRVVVDRRRATAPMEADEVVLGEAVVVGGTEVDGELLGLELRESERCFEALAADGVVAAVGEALQGSEGPSRVGVGASFARRRDGAEGVQVDVVGEGLVVLAQQPQKPQRAVCRGLVEPAVAVRVEEVEDALHAVTHDDNNKRILSVGR